MPVEFDNEMFAIEPQTFVMPLARREDGSDGRTNPIEGIGTSIVAELRRLGWDVPGFDVKFITSGSGSAVVRRVGSISGRTEEGPFYLGFYGSSGVEHEGVRVSTQLCHAIVPPGMDVHYYEDSGPTLDLYVGDNWQADGEAFREGIRVNSKLNGAPKTYLRYKGISGRGRDLGELVHYADLGREYTPEGSEPTSIDGREVAANVNAFLTRLCASLRMLPTEPGVVVNSGETDENLERLSHVPRFVAPKGFPKLYLRSRLNELHAGTVAHARREEVEPKDDYVVSGSGYRLVPYSIKVGNGVTFDRLHDGFAYATDRRDGAIAHPAREFDNQSMLIEVELDYLNDVYVADGNAYDRTRKVSCDRAERDGRNELTDAEVGEAFAVLARSVVPAAVYAGGYENPLYMIGRQLRGNEARPVVGPVLLSYDEDDEVIRVRQVDNANGDRITLLEYAEPRLYQFERAARTASNLAGLMSTAVLIDRPFAEARDHLEETWAVDRRIAPALA